MDADQNEQKQQVPVPSSSQQQEPAVGRILLLGYGNLDRQDDGVAWHILRRVAKRLNTQLPEIPEEHLYELSPSITVGFTLHLIPEHAEWLSSYERVLFLDAHTGSVSKDVFFTYLKPQFEPSPLTHHLTPATCLALCEALYQKSPQGALLSVRGFNFDFSQSLSFSAQLLLEPAVEQILKWLG